MGLLSEPKKKSVHDYIADLFTQIGNVASNKTFTLALDSYTSQKGQFTFKDDTTFSVYTCSGPALIKPAPFGWEHLSWKCLLMVVCDCSLIKLRLI